ncbi:cytochrome C oxidase copper chaperone-domain-containing protein [Blastocladiella britannica]|nr:cytochrome C oxidase copper chaperone-domain-containing protein [Blastocladiella britannica]
MGNTSSKPAAPAPIATIKSSPYDSQFPKQFVGYNENGKPVGADGKAFKPCCVCPETKQQRDECILREGSEESCREFIEKHKACLRSYGFNPK